MYQCEAATGIHMSPPSWNSLPPPIPSHPSRLSHSLGFELSHTADSYWLCILYLVMYMFQCCSLSLSHPLIPPSVSTSLFSMSMSPLVPCRYVYPYHPFRFLIYELIYHTCFSLSDFDCKVIHGFSNAQSARALNTHTAQGSSALCIRYHKQSRDGLKYTRECTKNTCKSNAIL